MDAYIIYIDYVVLVSTKLKSSRSKLIDRSDASQHFCISTLTLFGNQLYSQNNTHKPSIFLFHVGMCLLIKPGCELSL
jgi:hypothetical protein